MDQHVKVLAILNIVLGVLGVLAAVIIMIVMGGVGLIVSSDGDADEAIVGKMVGGIGAVVAVFVIVLSVPGIIAGYGLLHYRPWAPTLSIVISALNLLSPPFGTALGIYGLWVLLNENTKPLFRERATVSS